MVGQHEHGGVIGRLVAPPALPAVVGPGASDRPEHVAPHDPCSDVGEPARRKVVVDANRATVTSKHLSERTGGEGPFVQGEAADAQRIIEALVGASAVAVDGYAEAMDAKLGRGKVPLLGPAQR